MLYNKKQQLFMRRNQYGNLQMLSRREAEGADIEL